MVQLRFHIIQIQTGLPWWLNHPSETYARQLGHHHHRHHHHHPIFKVEHHHVFETTNHTVI